MENRQPVRRLMSRLPRRSRPMSTSAAPLVNGSNIGRSRHDRMVCYVLREPSCEESCLRPMPDLRTSRLARGDTTSSARPCAITKGRHIPRNSRRLMPCPPPRALPHYAEIAADFQPDKARQKDLRPQPLACGTLCERAGGAMAWPAVARAQQQAVPLIGFLSSRSPEESKPHLAGFLRGLEAFGYVDGKSARIEYRWANGQYDQLRKLAGELAAAAPCHHCGGRRRTFGARRKVGHDIHSDYFCSRRFRKRRSCRESQPAGRKHHRRRPDERRANRKKA